MLFLIIAPFFGFEKDFSRKKQKTDKEQIFFIGSFIHRD